TAASQCPQFIPLTRYSLVVMVPLLSIPNGGIAYVPNYIPQPGIPVNRLHLRPPRQAPQHVPSARGTLSWVNRVIRTTSGGGGRMESGRLCRACGLGLRQGARFCDGCGAPASADSDFAEYKQVTVM